MSYDKNWVFVTGMARSGTTLMDKVLSQGPQTLVLSQPLPLFFVEAKRNFLDKTGQDLHEYQRAYPLSDFFLENHYSVFELKQFLRELSLTNEDIRKIMDQMAGFSGQCTSYTPADLKSLPEESTFLQALKFLWECKGTGSEQIMGAKEIHCEEFLPFLMDFGFKCILVIRDPRDVMASILSKEGTKYTGVPKPFLFNIRHWRKSVAFALYLSGLPGFKVVRYEDLVLDPAKKGEEVFGFLGEELKDSMNILGERLVDQAGFEWSANSSHGRFSGISPKSVGSYQSLDSSKLRLIESLCLPEMRAMDYQSMLETTDALSIMENEEVLQEEVLHRPELSQYAWNKRTQEEEIQRLKALQDGRYSLEQVLFGESGARLSDFSNRGLLTDDPNFF